MLFDFDAFADELEKIAKEKAIYSPGVVSHEAGHAKIHRHPKVHGKSKTDLMGVAETVGPWAALGGYAAYKGFKGEGMTTGGVALATAAGMIPRLGDEYGSSIIGHRELKKGKSKKYTKEELAAERNRLIAAGTTYGIAPLAVAGAGQVRSTAAKKAVLIAAAGGQIGALAAANKPGGPKITAREAKKLVQDIAPGTEVYASKEPIGFGSAYVPPSKSKLKRFLVNLALAPYLKDKERKRIVERGGVMIAPMSRKSMIPAILGQQYTHDPFKRVK